jgi:nuclear pore complex protein Nup205
MLDDLNPLYVYEAKMSFLIRMAQTRPGAERLLEARIFPVLSQCEFLDTRPEADQSFMGMCFVFGVVSCADYLFRPGLFLAFSYPTIPSAFHACTSVSCCNVDYVRNSACDGKQPGKPFVFFLRMGIDLCLGT